MRRDRDGQRKDEMRKRSRGGKSVNSLTKKGENKDNEGDDKARGLKHTGVQTEEEQRKMEETGGCNELIKDASKNEKNKKGVCWRQTGQQIENDI